MEQTQPEADLDVQLRCHSGSRGIWSSGHKLQWGKYNSVTVHGGGCTVTLSTNNSYWQLLFHAPVQLEKPLSKDSANYCRNRITRGNWRLSLESPTFNQGCKSNCHVVQQFKEAGSGKGSHTALFKDSILPRSRTVTGRCPVWDLNTQLRLWPCFLD